MSDNYVGRGPYSVLQPQYVPRGYIDGLIMSTPGASATLTINPGEASDVTKTRIMALNAALAKTTGAWAQGAGNGGLDTGAIAASTWYHIHEIMRPDTGVVDALISLSPNAPVMPPNFSFRRRIGSWKTTAGSLWEGVLQVSDEFHWLNPTTEDIAGVGPAATTYVLPRVPTGVQVMAHWRGASFSAVNESGAFRIYSTSQADVGPSSISGTADMDNVVAAVTGMNVCRINVSGRTQTDTNGAVRVMGASGSLNLRVWSYIDLRGRDA